MILDLNNYTYDGLYLYRSDSLTNVDAGKSERFGLDAQLNGELFKSDYPLLKSNYDHRSQLSTLFQSEPV